MKQKAARNLMGTMQLPGSFQRTFNAHLHYGKNARGTDYPITQLKLTLMRSSFARFMGTSCLSQLSQSISVPAFGVRLS
jgi:hypothetical protein